MDIHQDVFERFEVPDPIRIQKVAARVRRHFGSLAGKKLLECGVVKGGLADVLAGDGAVCYGVDIHPRSGIGNTRTFVADLNDGFPDFGTAFDIVFAGEVMEHLFDDGAFIRRAVALLRPGGMLALTVPNLFFAPNRVRMLFGAMPLFAYEPYHYHLYSKRSLVRMLSGAGLSVQRVVSSHILFSRRRVPVLGRIFELLGDLMPSFGAHLIVFAVKT
jgi:2-polyprenyl-3-methyl-5-hydroxy-6-metoxy-1,4-benzoquinol methylase